jgi:hypothetical protein
MNEDLDTKFDAAVNALGPAASSVRGGAGDLFMEIQNPGIRANWMRCEPVTEDFFFPIESIAAFHKGRLRACGHGSRGLRPFAAEAG